MISLAPSRIVEALQAEVRNPGDDQPVAGGATDTRTPMPGALFIALRGGRFDAHDYLHGAVERGASALLVDSTNILPKDVPAIVVSGNVSAEAGEVTQVGSYSVYVVSDDGTRHRYLHMNPERLEVRVGDFGGFGCHRLDSPDV